MQSLQELTPILLGLSLLCTGLALAYTYSLQRKLTRFMHDKDGKSLEDAIMQNKTKIEDTTTHLASLTSFSEEMHRRISHTVKNPSLLRFKAFENGGSNQSFSVALLSERGNGLVFTSIHTRDRVSTFAKPVVGYVSTFDLSEEEKQVIDEARRAHTQNT